MSYSTGFELELIINCCKLAFPHLFPGHYGNQNLRS